MRRRRTPVWLLLAVVMVAAACDAVPTPPPPAQLAAVDPDPSPVDLDDQAGGSADPMATGAAVLAPEAASVRLPGEPDPILTPGALNPDVSQAMITATICVSGWTATIRPPTSYTSALKGQQIAQYGYPIVAPSAYEEDHLISLQLGGAPSDPRNLWPEPYEITLGDGRPTGARKKDVFETALKKQVCAGTISLADAQAQIGVHWVHAYYGLSLTIGGATQPSPSPLTVAIQSITAPAARGSHASVTAATAPAASCEIEVGYSSGPSKAAGLEPKAADATGSVSWTWTIGGQTHVGTWPVAVTCSMGTETATTGASLVIQ
jgi:hypothetical protein